MADINQSYQNSQILNENYCDLQCREIHIVLELFKKFRFSSRLFLISLCSLNKIFFK